MQNPCNIYKTKNEEFSKYSRNFTHFITYTPSLARIAGGVLAGLLFSRILYWWDYAQIFKNDRYWIANTQEQWQQELGFTNEEFRSASKKLIEIGLIKKEIFKFNSNPTTHFSVNEEIFIQLAKLEYDDNSNNNCRYVPIPQNDLGPEISDSELRQKNHQKPSNFSSVIEGSVGIPQIDSGESHKSITKKPNKETYYKETNVHMDSSSFVSSNEECSFSFQLRKIPAPVRKRWVEKYSQDIVIATAEMLREQYDGKGKFNLQALMESALKGGWVIKAKNIETNKGLAKEFKEKHQLHNLLLEKTGVVHQVLGKDAAYCMHPDKFQEQLLHIFREEMN
jgi:hypothetical protein